MDINKTLLIVYKNKIAQSYYFDSEDDMMKAHENIIKNILKPLENREFIGFSHMCGHCCLDTRDIMSVSLIDLDKTIRIDQHIKLKYPKDYK